MQCSARPKRQVVAFANAINEAFKKPDRQAGRQNRLLSNGKDYYFFNREPFALGVTSVLTEYAFIDNPKSTVFIDSPQDLKNEAQAIADGIHKVIGYTPVVPPAKDPRDEQIKELTERLSAAAARADEAERKTEKLRGKIDAALKALG